MQTWLIVLVVLTQPLVALAQEDAVVSILVFREDEPGRRVPLVGAHVSAWTEDKRAVSVASRLVAKAETDDFGVATLSVPAGEHRLTIVAPQTSQSRIVVVP